MTLPFLKVKVDGQARLVTLGGIREIVAMCSVQATSPDDPVVAVLNLRGEIVPLLDLSVDDRMLGPERFVLVCWDDDGDFGLIVDDVLDIAWLPEDHVNLCTGRPPFARLEQALVPVVMPDVVWTRRMGGGARVPVSVKDPHDRHLLDARAERCAAHDVGATEVHVEHAVFIRSGQRFAVSLVSLCEVRELSHLCRVPDASVETPGLVHHRGRLLSAHDLGALLRPQHHLSPDGGWIVVVEDEDRSMALIADEVVGIQTFAASQCLPVPIALGGRSVCFHGVVDDDILLVRPSGLFETPTHSHS